jgi:hypothetical protein
MLPIVSTGVDWSLIIMVGVGWFGCSLLNETHHIEFLVIVKIFFEKIKGITPWFSSSITCKVKKNLLASVGITF